MALNTLDRNTGLDLVRATEAAALSAAPWMGLGRREEPDQAAAKAMAEALSELDIDGQIVIGEEGRQGAKCALHGGQNVGSGKGLLVDVVVDAIDGRRLLAQGRGGAIAVYSCFRLLHAPFSQLLDGPFGGGELVGSAADVGGIQDQGCGDKFIERAPARTAGRRHPVGRQSPAGIERLTVAGDGDAAQQGFEAGQRGEHVQFIHLTEQLHHVAVRHDGVAPAGGFLLIRAFAPETGHDVGMRLIDQIGLRAFFAYRLQQAEVGRNAGRAASGRRRRIRLARRRPRKIPTGPLQSLFDRRRRC